MTRIEPLTGPPHGERDPASFTDPHGYLFHLENGLLRHIYPDARPWMREVFEASATRALMADGRLVSTTWVDEATLAHARITPVSYPCEWPAVMLQAAALLMLEVLQCLADDDLTLLDGHPWNIVFDGVKPVFVDFGSIGRPTDSLIWSAQAQFERFFRWPLHQAGQRDWRGMHLALRDPSTGILPESAAAGWRLGYRLRHPGIYGQLVVQAWMQRALANRNRAGQTRRLPTYDQEFLRSMRKRHFKGLSQEIARIAVKPDASHWVGYYGQCPGMTADGFAAKLNAVETVLSELRPATVLDLGANAGQFSLLAARTGARVVAVDQDEACMAALYEVAREQRQSILPLVMAVEAPTPASGWCAAQWSAAWPRLKSDVTLMLALMHHLVLTHLINFEQLADLIAATTHRLTILEWVEPDDEMARHLRATATHSFAWYTRDHLLDVLARRGWRVAVANVLSPSRELWLVHLSGA